MAHNIVKKANVSPIRRLCLHGLGSIHGHTALTASDSVPLCVLVPVATKASAAAATTVTKQPKKKSDSELRDFRWLFR